MHIAVGQNPATWEFPKTRRASPCWLLASTLDGRSHSGAIMIISHSHRFIFIKSL